MPEKKPSSKKRLILILKCLVSLGFVGMLLLTVQPEKLKSTFVNMDLRFALAGVALSFVMVAASTWKWWVLLKLQGCPLRFRDLYRWYFVGYFYSNFLPSNVGGDVARAWLASKKTGNSSPVLISIFAERFTGMIFLLLMAVGLPFLKPELAALPSVWIGSLAAAGGLGLILLLLLFGVRASRLQAVQGLLAGLRKLLRADRPGKPCRIWEKVAAKLQVLSGKLGELWQVLRTRPVALLQIFLLTALYYVLVVVNVMFAYRAFGVWADPAGVAAVLPVALIVAMLPVTPGGVGLAEGAYVYYFGLLGLAAELTLAMGLFLRMKILLLGLVGLVVHLKEPVERKP